MTLLITDCMCTSWLPIINCYSLLIICILYLSKITFF